MASKRSTAANRMTPAAAYGFNIPANLFEQVSVTVEGPVGVKLKDCFDTNSRLVVKSLERNSLVDGKLQFGDVLATLNGTPLQSKDQLKELWKGLSSSAFRFEIKLHRPVVKKDMEAARMPRAYEILPGSKYHIGIMYMIRGCNLSLPIKSYNNKVYVTRVIEDTMSSMALKMGDAILDVDKQPVANVKDAGELIVKQLESKGYATMVIERPEDPANRLFVRQALLAEKTVDLDLALPADVNAICKKELARMKAQADLQPKPILVEASQKSTMKAGRLKIDEKTEDVPIACDGNPALLVNVPPVPGSQYQPLAAFSDNKDNK